MQLTTIKKREEVEQLSSTILQSIESGSVHSLEILATVKAYEKVFETIKKQLITYALAEADQYAEKEINKYGVKFTKVEAGVSYDYSNCGHTEYNEVCEQIKSLTEIKKDYEKLLLSLKQMTPIISVNGEIMEVYPPAKKSTTTLKVNI